jgi:hypothetical protein
MIGTVVRKCCVIALALGNEYFCRSASTCGPKVKRGRPERGDHFELSDPK